MKRESYEMQIVIIYILNIKIRKKYVKPPDTSHSCWRNKLYKQNISYQIGQAQVRIGNKRSKATGYVKTQMLNDVWISEDGYCENTERDPFKKAR